VNVTTLLVIGAILVAIVVMHNMLVGRKNRIDEALGSISAYLKKRSDLIPNLIATVSQFTSHEAALLTELTKLRTAGTANPEQMVDVDARTSQALGRIHVAVEAYPQLTSSSNFLSLQQSLNEVEISSLPQGGPTTPMLCVTTMLSPCCPRASWQR